MSEETFNLAANYITTHHQDFSKDQLLKFYGFYKQATAGFLDEKENPKPSFFSFNARAKWDAWQCLGKLSENEARSSYVELLTSIKPEWENSSEIKNSSSSFAVSVSRMKSNDEILNESDKTIEDFIKEGNVEKFKELLNNIDGSELNSLDENQMGLLHWAADRGNAEILELILSQPGINVNILDGDQQSALHYASSCGHTKCINLLLSKGADKNLKDVDGNSCNDVAFDDEIKKLLC
jgi:acyl-CoA-binding protein